MTKDRAKDTFLPDFAQSAFGAFVGFIYATTIALVIRTAYHMSKFDSIVPATLTLLLLAFFAYDWLARFYGRIKMSGKMNESPTLFLLRLFLEIAIVYFLLLVSLKFVEIYAPLNWKSKWDLFKIIPGEPLCYSMAALAIFSGLWNTVMIIGSKQVNKAHIRCLFKGHLHEEIVNLFSFMKSWLDELEETKIAILDKVDAEVERTAKQLHGSPSDPVLGKEHLERIEPLRRDLRSRLLLKCLVRKPHHLLMPYLVVFHLVALNYVLGVFIASSRLFLEGTSLLAKLPLIHAFSPVLLLVGAFLSLLFLVIYFKSDRSKTFFERLGCACLALTVLLFYSVCSAKFLIVLVVLQQIGANFVMTRYFEPSKEGEKGPPHQTEVVEQGGQT